MSANTIAANRRRGRFADCGEIWLFGYGSLIFKADFPYLDRRPATIRDWVRRLWQGSHDHRGTVDDPGRVATLVPQVGSVCVGMAYLISSQVLEHLDYREKNGYLRCAEEMTFTDGARTEGLVYIATAENTAYLGPAPEQDIARHVARAEGPSGRNDDYVLQLARALREMSAQDDHIFEVAEHLERLRSEQVTA